MENTDFSAVGSGVITIIGLIALAVAILEIVSIWKLFVKAGRPGWASIIPIYNIIVALDICKMPIWWLILFIIPFANIVAEIMLAINFAKAYGKGIGMGIVLLFFPEIGLPILAFTDAKYVG